MKVLFNCHCPFSLAHGGAQIQIAQTMSALARVGVDVEPLRWWDDTQSGQILQHFGRIPTAILSLAQQKGIRVIVADLLTEQGSRSPARLRRQRLLTRFLRRTLPRHFSDAFAWDSYKLADACIALTPHEADLMAYLFEAERNRVYVVPNGVEEVFLNAPKETRGEWLVCTATITERKRVLELAEAAIHAQTPVWIIGKPYSEADPYGRRFVEVAKAHPKLIRFEGPISDRARLAKIYRSARGFVLLSAMESLSLSALEAAACECPLLLSDLPWARTVFHDKASYCPTTNAEQAGAALKSFYAAAPNLPFPPRPLSWTGVAEQLKEVYQKVLAGS